MNHMSQSQSKTKKSKEWKLQVEGWGKLKSGTG